MRDPTLRRVERTRDIVAVVLRFVGLWLLVLRVPSLVSQTGVLIWTASASNPRRSSWTVADEPWVFANGTLLLITLAAGVLALIKARELAHWLVPLPMNRCPRCDYPLGNRAVEPARCPECGLALRADLTDPLPPKSPDAPPPPKGERARSD